MLGHPHHKCMPKKVVTSRRKTFGFQFWGSTWHDRKTESMISIISMFLFFRISWIIELKYITYITLNSVTLTWIWSSFFSKPGSIIIFSLLQSYDCNVDMGEWRRSYCHQPKSSKDGIFHDIHIKTSTVFPYKSSKKSEQVDGSSSY